MRKLFLIPLLVALALLAGVARAEPPAMAGPDRRQAPLSGIGGGELALAVTTGVVVGAVAALVAGEVLLVGAGTLIAIEIGGLILEAVAIGGVVYF